MRLKLNYKLVGEDVKFAEQAKERAVYDFARNHLVGLLTSRTPPSFWDEQPETLLIEADFFILTPSQVNRLLSAIPYNEEIKGILNEEIPQLKILQP